MEPLPIPKQPVLQSSDGIHACRYCIWLLKLITAGVENSRNVSKPDQAKQQPDTPKSTTPLTWQEMETIPGSDQATRGSASSVTAEANEESDKEMIDLPTIPGSSRDSDSLSSLPLEDSDSGCSINVNDRFPTLKRDVRSSSPPPLPRDDEFGLEQPAPPYNLEGQWNLDPESGRRCYVGKNRKLYPFHHEPTLYINRRPNSNSAIQVLRKGTEMMRALEESDIEDVEYVIREADRIRNVQDFVLDSANLKPWDESGKGRSLEKRMEELLKKHGFDKMAKGKGKEREAEGSDSHKETLLQPRHPPAQPNIGVHIQGGRSFPSAFLNRHLYPPPPAIRPAPFAFPNPTVDRGTDDMASGAGAHCLSPAPTANMSARLVSWRLPPEPVIADISRAGSRVSSFEEIMRGMEKLRRMIRDSRGRIDELAARLDGVRAIWAQGLGGGEQEREQKEEGEEDFSEWDSEDEMIMSILDEDSDADEDTSPHNPDISTSPPNEDDDTSPRLSLRGGDVPDTRRAEVRWMARLRMRHRMGFSNIDDGDDIDSAQLRALFEAAVEEEGEVSEDGEEDEEVEALRRRFEREVEVVERLERVLAGGEWDDKDEGEEDEEENKAEGDEVDEGEVEIMGVDESAVAVDVISGGEAEEGETLIPFDDGELGVGEVVWG
ncbi:MAG: hypothetical protein Q9170_004972 [Blastenia crenularia]